jgi:hypothetical protein
MKYAGAVVVQQLAVLCSSAQPVSGHTNEPVPFNAVHSILTFYRAAVEQAATFEAVQPFTGSYLS